MRRHHANTWPHESGSGELDSAIEVDRILRPLAALTRETGAAITVLDHEPWSEGKSSAMTKPRPRHSGAKVATSDFVLRCTAEKDDDGRITSITVQPSDAKGARRGIHVTRMTIDLDGAVVNDGGEGEGSGGPDPWAPWRERESSVREYLKAHPGAGYRAVLQHAGIPRAGGDRWVMLRTFIDACRPPRVGDGEGAKVEAPEAVSRVSRPLPPRDSATAAEDVSREVSRPLSRQGATSATDACRAVADPIGATPESATGETVAAEHNGATLEQPKTGGGVDPGGGVADVIRSGAADVLDDLRDEERPPRPTTAEDVEIIMHPAAKWFRPTPGPPSDPGEQVILPGDTGGVVYLRTLMDAEREQERAALLKAMAS